MEPLQSTLAELTAAKLTDYARTNMPVLPAPMQIPAFNPVDPGAYIKQVNLVQAEGEVYGGGVDGHLNGHNQYLLDRFNFACRMWESNGKQGHPPDWPAFLVVDLAAFDQWWSLYNARFDQNSPHYGDDEYTTALQRNQFFKKPAPRLPDAVIVSEGAKSIVQPTSTDGPVGSAVPYNPGIFNPSPSDNYPDGYVYAGPTGIYQKHVYSNPFTAGNVRVIWIALQPTSPIPSAIKIG